MTIVQLATALEKYSIDILCLGFLVCGLTSLFKKFVPPKWKKYLTFVPFIIGMGVYAGYIFLTAGGNAVLDIRVAESGFKCGMMATIYYVMFEQFIRGKEKFAKTSDPRELMISGQLEGILLESYLKTIPKIMIGGIENHLLDNSYCEEFLLGTLKGKLRPAVTEQETINTVRLILTSMRFLCAEKI